MQPDSKDYWPFTSKEFALLITAQILWRVYSIDWQYLRKGTTWLYETPVKNSVQSPVDCPLTVKLSILKHYNNHIIMMFI